MTDYRDPTFSFIPHFDQGGILEPHLSLITLRKWLTGRPTKIPGFCKHCRFGYPWFPGCSSVKGVLLSLDASESRVKRRFNEALHCLPRNLANKAVFSCQLVVTSARGPLAMLCLLLGCTENQLPLLFCLL
ncbi:hypothetical protein AALO_G00135380 [Alosa alosa]|uniref:Uncharacterized protein n=1 Tax=Alosa alosa TaxID=278164 RepID=A0AAV6GLL5_9TELE|nr:hypothetical protein AALO_G00135380 [Alosa alosa]